MIVAAVLLVVIVSAFRCIKKPKTDLEIAQANLKEIEKRNLKQKEVLDKSHQQLETYRNDLIKKNEEMLEKIRRNQRV